MQFLMDSDEVTMELAGSYYEVAKSPKAAAVI